MKRLDHINKRQLKKNLPELKIGDKVKVFSKIIEGEKERVQAYEGTVICMKRGTVNATFTVRKVSSGIGVERVFQLHSPRIEDIKVMTHGKVRRSKLYYLRNLEGKASRLKEDTSYFEKNNAKKSQQAVIETTAKSGTTETQEKTETKK